MPKLNDTQNVILVHVARRAGGAVYPLPKSLKADAKAVERALKGLLRHGLVVERPAAAKETVWRETPEGVRLALAITDAGRAEIGMADAEPEGTESARKKPRRASNKGSGSREPVTRQDTLIGLLRRPGGATVPEMMETSSWQAHSVRGFISGTLKAKLGLTIESAVEGDRGRVYRVTEG